MKKPVLLAAAASLVSLGAFAAPDSLLGKKSAAGEPEFLPVDRAFEIQPLEDRSQKKDAKLAMGWRIEKGYYLYRERMKFKLNTPAGVKVLPPVLPEGEKHEDEHFGTVVIYRGKLEAMLPVSTLAKGNYSLTVTYQGCADAGLCYPPQTRTLEFTR